VLAAANKPAGELSPLVRGSRKREYDYAPPEQQPELRESLARELGTSQTQNEMLGSSLYLREGDLRALETRGVALGGHGATHHALTHLTDGHLASNIGTCRAWLEQVAPNQPVTGLLPKIRAT
jgi:peptidoglycan/xylan/chitin deacetylase (PgdA/CDA1 family)